MHHRVALLALAAAVGLSTAGAAESRQEPLVELELARSHVYAGDPIPGRVLIRAASGGAVPRAPGGSLEAGLEVRRAGETSPLERAAGNASGGPDPVARPGMVGSRFDLAALYPQLRAPGRYEVRWTADGLTAGPPRTVVVLPAYDPGRGYEAEVETDAGSFTIELFPEQAPVAVKAFVDMARAGFYDGTLVHEVVPDTYVALGVPGPEEGRDRPFLYPAELNDLPVDVGSVVMKPLSPAPPTNGSAFHVLLLRQPAWVGQVTVFGRIQRGMDVLDVISRVPSHGTDTPPFFKPLQEVRIRRILIFEKNPVPPAEPVGTTKTGPLPGQESVDPPGGSPYMHSRGSSGI